MKRTIVFLAICFSVCICFGQNGHNERIVQRIGEKPYILENGIKYEIDQTKIIAKLKPQQKLPSALCRESQNLGLGIIGIPVPEDTRVEDYLSLLKSLGVFEFVDYNTYGKYFFTPNDSLIGNQTGCQWYLDRIKAYEAWDITTGDPSIKVAVLDSGVDSCHYDLHYGTDYYTHLDIQNGYNYPFNTNYSTPLHFHGTTVAGVIGAKTDNVRGIAGISGGRHSAGITIIPYNVGNIGPSTDYVISAISNAVSKGVKIINMSFGFSNNNGVACAIDTAYNHGITIICAAGNENLSYLSFPASHSYTIAVGATDQSNARWQTSNTNGSNYGNGIDFVAPGVNIKSTDLNNSYRFGTGTSVAAPQVVGVAALMLTANPTLTPSQIRNTLQSTCTKLSGYSYNNGWNSEVGYGLINAYDAVQTVAPEIVGPNYLNNIDDIGYYYIDNLPSGLTVSWNLSDSYYNQYCLDQDDPAVNECSISYNYSHIMINDTLTADIKRNGITIMTLRKTGIYAYHDIRGHYTSGDISNDISSTHILPVRPTYNTSIISPMLIGATASYSSTATIPSSWNFNPSSGEIVTVMPSYNNNIPIVINIDDIFENTFNLYLFSTTSKSIETTYGDNSLTITLNDNGAEEGSHEDVPWTMEIRNATTGELMATKISTNPAATVSTSGWSKGLYVVKVTVDKEVFREKILVK